MVGKEGHSGDGVSAAQAKRERVFSCATRGGESVIFSADKVEETIERDRGRGSRRQDARAPAGGMRLRGGWD